MRLFLYQDVSIKPIKNVLWQPEYLNFKASKNFTCNWHCVKSVNIRSYSGLFRIWSEYGGILRISLYSVQMRKNTDQGNYEYEHFLRSVAIKISEYEEIVNFTCTAANRPLMQQKIQKFRNVYSKI